MEKIQPLYLPLHPGPAASSLPKKGVFLPQDNECRETLVETRPRSPHRDAARGGEPLAGGRVLTSPHDPAARTPVPRPHQDFAAG